MKNYELPKQHQSRPHTITIEDPYWQLALDVGGGNASKGIRIALQALESARRRGDYMGKSDSKEDETKVLL